MQTLIVTRSLNFYPRPPGGGRRTTLNSDTAAQRFLSTPSGWRATEVVSLRCTVVCISIHALRVEGDPKSRVVDTGWTDFYPRPPGGGRLKREPLTNAVTDFYPRPPGGGRPALLMLIATNAPDFYPRPPGGGRPLDSIRHLLTLSISIHALRVEGDVLPCGGISAGRDFYPRPPGGGRRLFCFVRSLVRVISIHALRVEGD